MAPSCLLGGKRHDWTYEMSDDYGVWQRGKASFKDILSRREELAKLDKDRAYRLFKGYQDKGWGRLEKINRNRQNNLLTILYDAAERASTVSITVHSPTGDVSIDGFVTYIQTLWFEGGDGTMKNGVDEFTLKVTNQD